MAPLGRTTTLPTHVLRARAGGFFGRVGGLLGRSRAPGLTILAYALFAGLSFFFATIFGIYCVPRDHASVMR